ncbi:MAG: hypothetical protein ISS29_03430 [Candidatus Marinimicrobia bacterium]|nr:hypothetical protein [Candidatus Neomarinimicrobiota bacterium]
MPSDNDQKTKTAIFAIFSILAIFLAVSCKECPTEPEDVPISISAEYTEASMIWLKVAIPDSGIVKSFKLKRDTTIVAEAAFTGKDTIIADKSVEPNKTYTYEAQYIRNGKVLDTSDPIKFTTLNTTSSNFSWEVFYFGDPNFSNYFMDVSIIDENNIWVVGEFKVMETDSAGNSIRCYYNAVHWDGNEWELKSLYPLNNFFAARGIKVFTENDIWITSNGTINHYNGEEVKRLWSIGDYTKGGVANIWGTSSSDIYFAGYKGTIVYYDGFTFTKMSSGTLIDLVDIDGNEERVFVTGYNIVGDLYGQSLALEYSDEQWNTIFTSNKVNGNLENGDFGRFKSVKVLDNAAVFNTAAAAMIKYYYKDRMIDFTPKKATILDARDAVVKIEGNGINDIVFITVGGEVVHFNGKNYQLCYDYEAQNPYSIMIYGGDCKGDVVCAVGDIPGQGVVIIGRR